MPYCFFQSREYCVKTFQLILWRERILGVFTLFNRKKFLPSIILLIDERLIPVCSAILRGDKCVCGDEVISVCAELLLVNKSVLQLNHYFLLLMLTQVDQNLFFLHGATVFETLYKSSFLMNSLSEFYTQTTLFLNNYFE